MTGTDWLLLGFDFFLCIIFGSIIRYAWRIARGPHSRGM